MLKDKFELEKYLNKKCFSLAINTELCNKIFDYAHEQYDIPKVLVSDYILQRKEISESTEFILFIILDSITACYRQNASLSVENFYTEKEIKFYRSSKYIEEKIEFPLKFKMVQIDEDQWIGKTDVKTLMKLRNAQIITYNTEAQRTMQKIVYGDKIAYKITVNKHAVQKIFESFQKQRFIPNTITLNIPMENYSDFHYSEDTCMLSIKELDHFDITDGYHRYIALCRAYDLDPDFNYTMELRIINFSEDKAKQFIYQEDQKTKMSKIASNSMNMDNPANIVVTRLNDNVRFNFKGLVSRNEGIIDLGEFAELVNYFYFKGKKLTKQSERIISIEATNEIVANFNMLSEYDTSYLNNRMEFTTLIAAMFCFDYFKKNPDPNIDVCDIIGKTAEVLHQNKKVLAARKCTKSTMKIVENYMKGVL